MHQASAELPTNALLVTSSCQEYLSTNRPDLMEALANATEMDTGATLRRLGEFALFNTTLSYRNNWRVGMDRGYIPLPFRHQGLLWWFQVLNTYLVRVSSASPGQRSLWRSLTRHAGIGKLEMFLQARRKMDIRPPPTVALPIGRARCGRGGRRPCDRIGAGWLPEAKTTSASEDHVRQRRPAPKRARPAVLVCTMAKRKPKPKAPASSSAASLHTRREEASVKAPATTVESHSSAPPLAGSVIYMNMYYIALCSKFYYKVIQV